MLIMRPNTDPGAAFPEYSMAFELPHAIAYCQSLHPVTNPCQTHTPVVCTSSIKWSEQCPLSPASD